MYYQAVDFDIAGYFTHSLASNLLGMNMPFDVDVLKLEVPAIATRESKIVIARQDKLSYYLPAIPHREDLSTPGKFNHSPSKGKYTRKDTDAYALAQGMVCITPLSLDLTSRGSLQTLAQLIDTPLLTPNGESGD